MTRTVTRAVTPLKSHAQSHRCSVDTIGITHFAPVSFEWFTLTILPCAEQGSGQTGQITAQRAAMAPLQIRTAWAARFVPACSLQLTEDARQRHFHTVLLRTGIPCPTPPRASWLHSVLLSENYKVGDWDISLRSDLSCTCFVNCMFHGFLYHC